MNTLPDDPYTALGVSKDATLAEIRSAHRKLVIKCHPDKVQDPAQKAQKADEFHKVQQAYEILSDDNKRAHYHEQLKVAQLRKEMGKTPPRPGGTSTTTANPFNVHDVEPRPSTFTSKPFFREPDYPRTPQRSFEDLDYDEPFRRSARKTGGSESQRPSTREDERRRRMDSERELERERDRRDKENLKSSHSDKKKARDKERKKGSEDKYRATQAPYVEDNDSEEERIRRPQGRSDRRSPRSSSRYDEEFARMTAEANRLRLEELTERTRKYNGQLSSQAQYIKKAKNDPRGGISRASTFNEGSFRHVPAKDDYVDAPRRASVSTAKASRRTPETNSRDSPRSSKDKRSHDLDPHSRTPSLQKQRSEPPNPSSSRKDATRAKTFASSKSHKDAPIPNLARAKTWQSNTKTNMESDYTSESSESSDDDQGRRQSRRPSLPTRQSTTTAYKIDHKQGVPSAIPVHRAPAFQEDSEEDLRPRVIGVAPPVTNRPPLNRKTASGYEPPHVPSGRSQSQSHSYATRAPSPEPLRRYGIPERPKLARDGSGLLYGEVPINVASSYGLDNVNVQRGYQRATSDRYQDDYHQSRRPRGTVH